MTIVEVTAERQIDLAKEYFLRVDSQDVELLSMFTEDAQVYFPKVGTVHGKVEISKLIRVVGGVVELFVHDVESMIFTQAGNRLVVEGKETGVLVDGTQWPVSARSEGRYCNVFEFRGNLISRMHVHADPDFAGQHDDLFRGTDET